MSQSLKMAESLRQPDVLCVNCDDTLRAIRDWI